MFSHQSGQRIGVGVVVLILAMQSVAKAEEAFASLLNNMRAVAEEVRSRQEREAREGFRENLEKTRQAQLARIELRKKVREFALANTESADTVPHETTDRYLKNWRMISARKALRFSELPEHELAHNIKSGDALNHYLDRLGSLAQGHEAHLQELRDLKELAEKGESELWNESQAARLQILEDIESACLIDAQSLREVDCEYGMTGRKLKCRLGIESSLEPLPLDWPVIFKNDHFTDIRSALERQRQLALDEVYREEYMAKGQRGLVDRVNSLRSEYARYCRELNMKGQAAGQSMEIAEGHRFLESLRYGIPRLIESASFARDEQFVSRRPDGKFSAIQLLAYMDQYRMRFSAAEMKNERHYANIFRGLKGYDVELRKLRVATDPEVAELEWTEQRMQALEQEVQSEHSLERFKSFSELLGKGLEFAESANRAEAAKQTKEAAEFENDTERRRDKNE